MIALYKTFDGEEWILASLASIYNHVDHILMIHSDTDWLGNRSKNTVAPVVSQFSDYKGKIIELNVSIGDQDQQYAFGLDFIKRVWSNQPVMIIDSDEVWDEYNIERLKSKMCQMPEHNTFKCRMHTYVRSPYYRVTPPEPCRPTVVVRSLSDFAGCRGSRSRGPVAILDDVYFHHFTFVRSSDEKIKAKILRTAAGDKTPSFPVLDWYNNKYLALPKATNFHHAANAASAWQKCEVISLRDLPTTVHQMPLVQKGL